MTPQEEFVPLAVYQQTLAVVFSQLQQITTLSTAMIQILHEKQIMTPESWAAALNKAELSEAAQNVRKSIEKLLGISSIEDILRDFEGPIQ